MFRASGWSVRSIGIARSRHSSPGHFVAQLRELGTNPLRRRQAQWRIGNLSGKQRLASAQRDRTYLHDDLVQQASIVELTHQISTTDEPHVFAIDTIALGVRTSKEFTCPGCSYGGGHNLYLTLFVVDGKQLRSIWSTRMASSSWEISAAKDDMSRDHTSYGSDDPATISLLKSVSRGQFDLKKTFGRRSCTYRWDGKQYGCAQEDPVKDMNNYGADE